MQLENKVGCKQILEGRDGIIATRNYVAIDDQVEEHWVTHRSDAYQVRVRTLCLVS